MSVEENVRSFSTLTAALRQSTPSDARSTVQALPLPTHLAMRVARWSGTMTHLGDHLAGVYWEWSKKKRKFVIFVRRYGYDFVLPTPAAMR
jgi:hypothetical protein